jgi:hypothetical protein
MERVVQEHAGMHPSLTRVLHGALAGVIATGAMSALMLAAKRVGVLGEPPPRRLTRKLLSHLGPIAPRGRKLDAAALVNHFAFGSTMGGLFGLAIRRPTPPRGLLFGLGVWALAYTKALPRLGLMPPARRDRPGRPSAMIAAHLVYGATLAACQRRLND